MIASATAPRPVPAEVEITTLSILTSLPPLVAMKFNATSPVAVNFIVSLLTCPILSELVAPILARIVWLEYAPTWNSLLVKLPASRFKPL